jgi:type I restriction enzyme, S subunit
MTLAATKIAFQKFPAYKNSGVEWLGKIPEHWEVGKLGTLLKPVSIKNHADLPLLSITREEGVIERNIVDDSDNHNFIPDDLSGYKLLRIGQFGMNKMKAWQGSYGISPMTGIVSPAYFVFDFNSSINPRFFHLAIRSKNYVAFFGQASDGVRIGQWDLSKTRMKEIPFFIPPIEEQTAIAAFLDDKTAKIDHAIAKKQKMITLLKERKQIIIQDLVTGKKVWNPTQNAWTDCSSSGVGMKDSGVEWIGEIPEHWEVKRLKFILKTPLKYGANESGVEYSPKLPRYVRITDFSLGGKLNEDKKLSLSWEIGKNYLLEDGDILFARSGATVGKSYQFKKSMSFEKHYTFAGYLIKASPNEDIIISDFFNYFTMSGSFDNWKSLIFNKATIENIGADKYSELKVVIPSIKDQTDIVAQIKTQSTKIDHAIALQQQQIEKLKEYKAVLIDGAVTGKIKIN